MSSVYGAGRIQYTITASGSFPRAAKTFTLNKESVLISQDLLSSPLIPIPHRRPTHVPTAASLTVYSPLLIETMEESSNLTSAFIITLSYSSYDVLLQPLLSF
jgi:hypothetical protein